MKYLIVEIFLLPIAIDSILYLNQINLRFQCFVSSLGDLRGGTR